MPEQDDKITEISADCTRLQILCQTTEGNWLPLFEIPFQETFAAKSPSYKRPFRFILKDAGQESQSYSMDEPT